MLHLCLEYLLGCGSLQFERNYKYVQAVVVWEASNA